MKTKLNKLSMMVVAAVMFASALFMSVERDQQGNWGLGALSAFAQSEGSEGSSGGTIRGEHSGLSTTNSFFNPYTKGNYTCFKPAGATAGTAKVTLTYTLTGYVYSKKNDHSFVEAVGDVYNIAYTAEYTVNGFDAFNMLDAKQIFWD
jgi:ABC-type sugar transport system substrate-binding protein